MASIRDFFYVLRHYKEITDELERGVWLAAEAERWIKEADERMVFFTKSMCIAKPTGVDIKITVCKN